VVGFTWQAIFVSCVRAEISNYLDFAYLTRSHLSSGAAVGRAARLQPQLTSNTWGAQCRLLPSIVQKLKSRFLPAENEWFCDDNPNLSNSLLSSCEIQSMCQTEMGFSLTRPAHFHSKYLRVGAWLWHPIATSCNWFQWGKDFNDGLPEEAVYVVQEPCFMKSKWRTWKVKMVDIGKIALFINEKGGSSTSQRILRI